MNFRKKLANVGRPKRQELMRVLQLCERKDRLYTVQGSYLLRGMEGVKEEVPNDCERWQVHCVRSLDQEEQRHNSLPPTAST